MAVCMSLPYRTRASVQPYPVVCTVPRLSGQIQSHEAATKVRTAKGASQWTISPPIQTKVGGIGVAMRTYGRLINKSAAFFRAPSPAESYLRRKAPCPPQAPKKCSISPASRLSIRN